MSTQEFHDRYLQALLVGDRRRAQAVVADARAAGLELRQLYLDVFQPAMWEIGRLWQGNQISVADEHLATAITQMSMASLYSELFALPDDGNGRTLIAACVDVERHEMGLRMLCDLLELAGWDTTFLGATVPTDGLVAMVRERGPDVVALSVALLPHVPRAERMIRALREELGAEAPLIMVGGQPFIENPALAGRLGADLTASDAASAVELLQRRFAP